MQSRAGVTSESLVYLKEALKMIISEDGNADPYARDQVTKNTSFMIHRGRHECEVVFSSKILTRPVRDRCNKPKVLVFVHRVRPLFTPKGFVIITVHVPIDVSLRIQDHGTPFSKGVCPPGV